MVMEMILHIKLRFENTVNTEEVGTYEVIYSITNSQGNNIQRTRKVEVIKNESEKKNECNFSDDCDIRSHLCHY